MYTFTDLYSLMCIYIHAFIHYGNMNNSCTLLLILNTPILVFGYILHNYTTSVHYAYRDARNMARDVHNTLIDIVEKYGKMETVAATEYIKKLQKRGRYLQDVWT